MGKKGKKGKKKSKAQLEEEARLAAEQARIEEEERNAQEGHGGQELARAGAARNTGAWEGSKAAPSAVANNGHDGLTRTLDGKQSAVTFTDAVVQGGTPSAVKRAGQLHLLRCWATPMCAQGFSVSAVAAIVSYRRSRGRVWKSQ